MYQSKSDRSRDYIYSFFFLLFLVEHAIFSPLGVQLQHTEKDTNQIKHREQEIQSHNLGENPKADL